MRGYEDTDARKVPGGQLAPALQTGLEVVEPVRKRLGENMPMSWEVFPFCAKSAKISPTTLQNLKPCPEKPAATETWGCSGCGPMMKCSSGLLVNIHTLRAIVGPCRIGEIPLGEGPQHILISLMALTVQLVGVGLLGKVVVLAHLEARDTEHWKAIKPPFLHKQVEDGEFLRCEVLRLKWLEPGEHLPLGHSQIGQRADMGGGPSSNGDYQGLRLVNAPVSYDSYGASYRLPLQDLLPAMHLGSQCLGGRYVSDNAPFREKESAVPLEDRHRILREAVPWKATVELAAAQDFVRQTVLLTGTKGALKDGASWRPGVYGAGNV